MKTDEQLKFENNTGKLKKVEAITLKRLAKGSNRQKQLKQEKIKGQKTLNMSHEIVSAHEFEHPVSWTKMNVMYKRNSIGFNNEVNNVDKKSDLLIIDINQK